MGNDPAAWEALVRQHQTPLFRMAYLITGAADDAQDVAQETFIQAHQHLGKFDASRPLRPWLLAIARNRARNRRRSLGRYTAAVGRWFGGLELAGAPDPSPAQAAADADRSVQLWAATRRLAPADQDVIYARYYLELGVAETADVLAVPVGTVKSRLARATQRLRAVIEREFPALATEPDLAKDRPKTTRSTPPAPGEGNP